MIYKSFVLDYPLEELRWTSSVFLFGHNLAKNALPVFEDFYYILFMVKKALIQGKNRQNVQYPSINSWQ